MPSPAPTSTSAGAAPSGADRAGEPTAPERPRQHAAAPNHGQNSASNEFDQMDLARVLSLLKPCADTLQSAIADPVNPLLPPGHRLKATLGRLLQGVLSCTQKAKQAPLTQILNKLDNIQRTLPPLTGPLPRTWASIAANPQPTLASISTLTATSVSRVTTNGITIRSPKGVTMEDNVLQSLSSKDIIQRTHELGISGIVGANKLPSGDIRLLTTPEAEERLRKDTSWINRLQPGATAVRKLFSVEVISVPTKLIPRSASKEELQETINRIQAENRELNPGLTVARISWLNPKRASQQTRASLIVDVLHEHSASNIIRRGFIADREFFSARPYDHSCMIIQCFNCQGYGHTTGVCQRSVTCGHCAEEHNTKSCPQESIAKCANCGGKHKAWDRRNCNLYRKRKEQATARRIALLTADFYTSKRMTTTSPMPPQCLGKRNASITNSTDPSRQGPENEGRRPRGRPRAFDRRDPNQPQLSSFLPGAPEAPTQHTAHQVTPARSQPPTVELDAIVVDSSFPDNRDSISDCSMSDVSIDDST
jgi:hypothetical protein